MENSNPAEVSEWVLRQTSYLAPPAGWHPDPAAAQRRFQARQRTRRLQTWAVAAALVGALLVALPLGPVVAQQLWQMLTVKQVAFIRVNPWPKGVPSPQVNLIGNVIPPLPARDTADARWRVNYDPRLPRPGVLSSSPRLSTTFSLSAGTVIKVADLQLALAKAGVTGETVPSQWDGAQLALHTSGIVIAEWPDAVLAQSLPLTLTTSPGFDFPAFSTLVLRVLGVAPDEALKLARQMGTTPTWLAPIDRNFDQRATIEQIALRSGPATLLQQLEEDGTVYRTTIVWSVPDRVYLLHGRLSRALAIATADAVQ